MYDEVMQLIALAKNDEEYFKRIEALKQQMLELAQVKEIAKTLGEADMHLAKSRQDASDIIETAKKEAEDIKAQAQTYVDEQKQAAEKAKAKKQAAEKKDDELKELIAGTTAKQEGLEKAILEHRKLTQERSEELEKAGKVRKEFEEKLKLIREIAAR